MRAAEGRLRVATYNVHGCVGSDRREDVGRVARALRRLDADIVALQEVLWLPGRLGKRNQLHRLAEDLSMLAVPGPTLVRGKRHYGNALLSRLPIAKVALADLSHRRREPRGALEVRTMVGGALLTVIATHLGLNPGERRAQLRRLGDMAARRPGPLVLLGDMNEWLPWRQVPRCLRAQLPDQPAPRGTYPARLPLFPLDRIWVRPARALVLLEARRTPEAKVASDHLPVLAVLRKDLLFWADTSVHPSPSDSE